MSSRIFQSTRLLQPAYQLLVLLPCCIFSALWSSPVSADQRSERQLQLFSQQVQELHDEFSVGLNNLASRCEQQGLMKAASQIRDLMKPAKSNALESLILPDKVHDATVWNQLSPPERKWRDELQKLQVNYAQQLYLHARRVLTGGFPSYAFELIQETLRHDSDHRNARRLLGYVRYKDRWVTPFSVSMFNRRYVWHEKFGWLLRTHVERYERGERYYKGRWISAEKEAEIRRDFANAWTIQTDHFLVKTDHSLERGVEVAKALEVYHQFFFQHFTSFFNTPDQIQRLFEGGVRSSSLQQRKKPYEVHFYRSKEEYVERLRDTIPQIAITDGIYLTGKRTSYFFHNPDRLRDFSTIYHEATHQIMYESQAVDRDIATRENFWIVEGIACYLESFQQKKDGTLSIGDPHYIRFQNARHRLLVSRYYVQLVNLASMGILAFQSDNNISKNYSQSSGLAHFFMHYKQGIYRDALIEHLSQIYRPPVRGKPLKVDSLAELTGVPFHELDKQYILYIKAQQDAIQKEKQN